MSKKSTLVLLIVLTIVYVLSIPVWFGVLMMLVMGAASIGSNVIGWIFLAVAFSYPLAILAGMIGGWISYNRTKYKSVLLWNVYSIGSSMLMLFLLFISILFI